MIIYLFSNYFFVVRKDKIHATHLTGRQAKAMQRHAAGGITLFGTRWAVAWLSPWSFSRLGEGHSDVLGGTAPGGLFRAQSTGGCTGSSGVSSADWRLLGVGLWLTDFFLLLAGHGLRVTGTLLGRHNAGWLAPLSTYRLGCSALVDRAGIAQ